METSLIGNCSENHATELTEFERRAKVLSLYFNSNIRYSKEVVPPPFIVEFFGPPSAGRTTTIRELDKLLRRHGFRCYHPQEGAEAVRYLTRDTPKYNIATGLYAYSLLLELSEGHQYDFVLFERCMFDAYSRMKYWNKKAKLDENAMRSAQEFFLFGASYIDVAFMMYCTPSVAMDRETINQLTNRLGNSTNPAALDFLIECSLETCDELIDRFPIAVIETTHLTEKQMVQITAKEVLDALETKIIQTRAR